MPLTLRLSLTYLLVTLAGALLLGVGLIALAERYLEDEAERALAAQVAIYAALLGELAAAPGELPALAAGLAGDLLPAGTAVRVFGNDGGLLAGDPALGPFPSRPARDLVRPSLPLPASQVPGRRYAARSVPGGSGVIEISRDSAADARLLSALRRIALQAALAAALAMGLVSSLLARSLARPIVRLTRRAEALAWTMDAGQSTMGEAPPEAALPPAAAVVRRSPGAPRSEIRQLAGSLDQLEGSMRGYLARIDHLEQARARFYRSVSHELRTPLTAIRATLENLADRVPAGQRAAVATLESETARLSRLVDELLRQPADGRLLSLERRSVELGELAGELCALLAGRARRAGVELRCAPTAIVMASVDRDRVKQALLNLLDNALRVTPPGGKVVLQVGSAGNLAQLSVADSGPGVPAGQHDAIWERGTRGAPAVAGSAGLGLAIVREIVAAHAGRVYLDPAYAPGARFVIELPLAGAQRAAGQGQALERREEQ